MINKFAIAIAAILFCGISSALAQVGTVREDEIRDGSILARVTANETVSGSWSFTSALSVTGHFSMLPYGTSSGETSELRFLELAAGGSDYLAFKAPDSVAAPVTWTWPAADAAGAFVSDGAGNLSISPLSGAPDSASYVTASGEAGLSAERVLTGTAGEIDVTDNGAGSTVVLGIVDPLVVTKGGTGTATALTAGSVVFAGASGVYSQDNSKLFWDDANDNLGVGTATPTLSNTTHRGIDIAGGAGNVAELKLHNASSGSGALDGFNFALSGLDGYFSNRENGDLFFYTNNAEKMKLDNGNAHTITGSMTVSATLAANVLSGPLTCTACIDATDIAASAVTYAKIQNVSATARVLGRKTAGAGVVEELSAADLVSAGLGGGDITAVTAGTMLTGGGTSGDVTLNFSIDEGSSKTDTVPADLLAVSDAGTALHGKATIDEVAGSYLDQFSADTTVQATDIVYGISGSTRSKFLVSDLVGDVLSGTANEVEVSGTTIGLPDDVTVAQTIYSPAYRINGLGSEVGRMRGISGIVQLYPNSSGALLQIGLNSDRWGGIGMYSSDGISLSSGSGALAISVDSSSGMFLNGIAVGTGNTLVLDGETAQVKQVVSSLRYKNHIDYIKDDGLTDRLKPAMFTYKGTSLVRAGLYAEDVAEVFPEAVNYDKLRRPDSIDWPSIIALILHDLQRARKELATLKAKVASRD